MKNQKMLKEISLFFDNVLKADIRARIIAPNERIIGSSTIEVEIGKSGSTFKFTGKKSRRK
ncbi:MAG: hypothetical protein JSU92_09735 [Deltaproteobacteria bacterium]|nr:MAG: hypothetical protein JSU92_09735 [Deltaproteobacteria bacterium]